MFHAGEKLNNEVEFPLRGLDVAPYLVETPAEGSAVYDLYAVCNHFGTMRGGHYTAVVHDAESDTWINCDDSICSPVDEAEVVTPAAYVLFYQRRRSSAEPDLLEIV